MLIYLCAQREMGLCAGLVNCRRRENINNKSLHRRVMKILYKLFFYFQEVFTLGFAVHMIEARLDSNHQLVKIYYLLYWGKFHNFFQFFINAKRNYLG